MIKCCELVLIAAVARNGVIGHDNRLLWKLPEDMAFFRQATTGHPVIMGRKTWESLPARFRPLPGRRNIVISRNAQYAAPGAQCAGSLDAALGLLADAPQAFVMGGAEIYAQALPLADELLLTEIEQDFAGDAVFPAWSRQDFSEVERSVPAPGSEPAYSRARYRRHPPRA